jgi:hypothetical protein
MPDQGAGTDAGTPEEAVARARRWVAERRNTRRAWVRGRRGYAEEAGYAEGGVRRTLGRGRTGGLGRQRVTVERLE